MINELLVNVVDSVLGAGKRTARGNQSYHCPFCNYPQPRLEINFTEGKKGYNPWHCWHCDISSNKLYHLFKQLEVSQDKFDELKQLIGSESTFEYIPVTTELKLPDEFQYMA